MGVLARATPVCSRILAIVVGGYVATVGLVALFSVLLALVAGMARSEAIVLTSMIGFLIYPAFIIWGWTERSKRRLWLTVVGIASATNVSAIGLAGLLPIIANGG